MKIDPKRLSNTWTVLGIIAVFIAVYLSTLHPWMNHWGATDAEMNTPLPGDGQETGAVTTSTRAVTVHAPAGEVWKWVVQLGQERAGFYSNDWLENLVLSDIHNSAEIRPEWQSRQQGGRVYGAGGAVYRQSSFWTIKVYEEGRVLYLWGPIVVLPVDDTTTRLLVRTYAVPTPEPAQTITKLTYDWMHFVMERGMLLGIKVRAEGTLGANRMLTLVANSGWIVATLGLATVLFSSRRGRWWGLLPLAYAIAIMIFTSDLWAAMAGFLWWGVIAAGFLIFGRNWWKGLSLAIVAVVLIFVLASQPYVAFGIIFLVITLVILVQIKNNGSSVFSGREDRNFGCERAYARSQPKFRYFSRHKR